MNLIDDLRHALTIDSAEGRAYWTKGQLAFCGRLVVLRQHARQTKIRSCGSRDADGASAASIFRTISARSAPPRSIAASLDVKSHEISRT